MDSAEVRTKIKVENTLSTRQVMQGRFSDFDVQGTSLEADGDRLLLPAIMKERWTSTEVSRRQIGHCARKCLMRFGRLETREPGRSLAMVWTQPLKTALPWSFVHLP